MFDRFILALRAAGLAPDAESVADFFFLASRLPVNAPTRLSATEPVAAPGEVTARRETDNSPLQRIPALPEQRPDSEPKSGLFTRDSSPEGTIPAAEIEVPEAPALPQSLEIARALRPFSKQFRTRGIGPLDEDATAEQSAHLRSLVFVFRPSSERWFDLALLVEDTPSMSIWARTINSFEKTLVGLGAFRDVRRWRLHADATLTDSSGKPSQPAAVLSPDGRRLVLILTQGVSAAWQSNRFGEAIQRWAMHQPTAVVQLLPERLWGNTSLGEPMLLARSPLPGLPNAQWEIEFPLWMKRRMTGGIALPVLSLDSASLGDWAQMLMSRANASVPAVFSSALARLPAAAAENPPADIPAEDRLDRFRRNASPESFRLATALSTGPVTLPVLRLINQTLFGESARQDVLAEVLLGGLLYKVHDNSDAEQVYFDFHSGVRAALAKWSQSGDRFEVRRQVTRYLQAHPDTTQRFRVLVPRKGGKQRLPAWAEPFADESEALLRAYGLFEEDEPLEPTEPEAHPASSEPEQHLTRRLAILIGIDAYPEQVPESDGNSKELLALSYLLERRSFETILLLNEEATMARLHEAISSAQEHLTPTDLIWIHFSGLTSESRVEGAQLFLRGSDPNSSLFAMSLEDLTKSLQATGVPALFTCGHFAVLPDSPQGISSLMASIDYGNPDLAAAGLVTTMLMVISTSEPGQPISMAEFADRVNQHFELLDRLLPRANGQSCKTFINDDTQILFPPIEAPEVPNKGETDASDKSQSEEGTDDQVLDQPSEETISSLLPHDIPEAAALYGRADEIAELDHAWKDSGIHLVQIVGAPGSGKTALMSHWSSLHRSEAETFFYRSFATNRSIESFFDDLASFLRLTRSSATSMEMKAFLIAQRLLSGRSILLLDELDSVLNVDGSAVDPILERFLGDVVNNINGLAIVATRTYWTGMSQARKGTSIYLSPYSDFPGLASLRELQSRAFDPGPAILDDPLPEILKTAMAITLARQAFFYSVLAGETDTFQFESGIDSAGNSLHEDPRAEPRLLAEAVKAKKPILTRIFTPYLGSSESEVEASRALVRIPLLESNEAGSRVLGVIYLEAPSAIPARLLPELTAISSSLIERSRRSRSEQEAHLREELAEARTQHLRLLDVSIPQIDFARISVRFETAEDVGGDCYDVVVAHNALFIMLADVAGKGLSATMLAKKVYSLVHYAFLDDQPLDGIAGNLNEILHASDPAHFVTMVLARLTSEGTLTYLNCGSISPLLLGDGTCLELAAGALPIGLMPSLSFPIATQTLQAGDRLLLVSDGISDAEGPNGETYGDLQQHVLSTTTLDGLISDWTFFRAGAPFRDDWTAIEVQFSGQTPQTPFFA